MGCLIKLAGKSSVCAAVRWQREQQGELLEAWVDILTGLLKHVEKVGFTYSTIRQKHNDGDWHQTDNDPIKRKPITEDMTD